MNKQQLRKKHSLIRKAIENRDEKDKLIAERLQDIVRGHESVFCYVSFGSEVGTHDFIRANAEKIYIPYTNDGVMKCLKYVGGDLTADKQGNVALSCYGEQGTPTITVVPMLAFDSACYRLGYGGGYYDRYLSSAFTVKVGVAYDEQFTNEAFCELFDVPLDMIITPTKIHKR
ncbi:MAG: 5-formyltetrahydrofolate cyclo-ligase [Clostridiales bacterium]|nr:5-formyltetrahydrofolate cyclo-ligase [Clostridiales bacterium]